VTSASSNSDPHTSSRRARARAHLSLTSTRPRSVRLARSAVRPRRASALAHMIRPLSFRRSTGGSSSSSATIVVSSLPSALPDDVLFEESVHDALQLASLLPGSDASLFEPVSPTTSTRSPRSSLSPSRAGPPARRMLSVHGRTPTSPACLRSSRPTHLLDPSSARSFSGSCSPIGTCTGGTT
jgi:hypothetical protein